MAKDRKSRNRAGVQGQAGGRQRRGGAQNKYGTVISYQICICQRPGYQTRQNARLVARQMRQRYNAPFSAYECQEATSEMWHVTRAAPSGVNLNDPASYSDGNE